MLNAELLASVKAYTEKLTRDVIFVVQTGEHEKRAELVDFLTQFAGISDRLHVAERDAGLRGGADLGFGVNHDLYRHEVTVPQETRDALLRDLA